MPTPEIVSVEGVKPFYFNLDYKHYSGEDGKRPGDIAGLKVDVGDQLAATVLEVTRADHSKVKVAICRRARAQDFERKKEYAQKSRPGKTALVAVTFDQAATVDGKSYRGPTADKKADTAGFPARLAAKLCDGYLTGQGGKVGAVASYYVDTVDEELEAADPASKKTADRPKPAVRTKRDRRQKASPDPKGAPHQKG